MYRELIIWHFRMHFYVVIFSSLALWSFPFFQGHVILGERLFNVWNPHFFVGLTSFWKDQRSSFEQGFLGNLKYKYKLMLGMTKGTFPSVQMKLNRFQGRMGSGELK